MKQLFLILFCMALVGCAPVVATETDAVVDSTAAPQSEAEIITEEINLDDLAGGHVEIVGGDEQSLRKFIQRYFSPIYPGAGENEMKILIGSLPDDLPIDLPLPEGAQVVASVQEPSAFTQLILDVPLTPGEIESFYTQTLSDLGWRSAPEHQPGGGFVSSWDSGGRFCLGENDAYLEVRSLDVPEGLTDARLTLQAPVEYYPCQEEDAGYADEGSRLIPSLEAPRDVQITSSGAGSSNDGSAYISADLQTSLSIDDLLAHYIDQLEKAGWELVDQGISEVVAWSAWKFLDDQGDEWGGNLIVMENRLESERRIAIVSIEQID